MLKRKIVNNLLFRPTIKIRFRRSKFGTGHRATKQKRLCAFWRNGLALSKTKIVPKKYKKWLITCETHKKVPIYAYQSASYFYGSRILHYINSDLESARAKFMFREKFDTKIFDKNLATDEKRELYKLWEDKWTQEEGMPRNVWFYIFYHTVKCHQETSLSHYG